jgi:uncharacterized MAPEG superfamily protein
VTIPVWVLLAFAGWTVLTLLGSIGVYRWSRILTGRADLNEFPADRAHGADWYRRAMRAHANCVENLPVYAALVIVINASGVAGSVLDYLAIGVVTARIPQTVVHIVFPETNVAVGVRFMFFFMQLLCFLGIGIAIAVNAW